jgi:acyl-[acyl-carrier-protein]-phospholipid O-acyltransferase / long-chain-fatty-acid--[acyl-carrier-protein] ligase
MLRLFRFLFRIFYRFRTFNEGVLSTKGPVLLLSNHVSWWDWLFLGVCLENDWRFVTSSITAELSWIHKRIMVNRRTFPVDMNSPYAVKHIAAYLNNGGRLALFPEGRMSTTGSLMKLFEGTGFLASRTHAKIITAFIRGADRLPLSPNQNRKRWFPAISVHFSSLLDAPHPEHVTAMEARSTFTTWLQDAMVRQRFETEMTHGPATIPGAIVHTARSMRGSQILQDATLTKLSYGNMLVGAAVLSAKWELLLAGTSRVGVLLPNVNAFPVVLLSLWFGENIPAILNYTSGPATLLACAQLAGLRKIITSRAFLERVEFNVGPLQAAGVELVFLEDVRSGISLWERLVGAFRGRFLLQPALTASPSETAVVLFTSGSEGEPKGVELSHTNVLANIRQMLSVIDLWDSDRFFNALPLFHSFGLTIGLLLPLMQGTFVFLYLSPLHYRVIPAAFYNLNCTVLFGTNTFLAAYGRKAHPYDFHTLRYVFAGAERLQPATAAEWMNKFGVRILEGYGATECSPCVSVNVPMHSRVGSAGRFLPGIEHRLEHVEGIEDVQHPVTVPHSGVLPSHSVLRCGRLFVRGANVMRGYVNEAANRKFQELRGWYDTGDIAGVDADGFVFILGRLKRFAKVSGEMISLTAVEDALCGAFPQYGPKFTVAVLARPDALRGERLIAVTNEPRLTLMEVRERVQASGLSNLAVPKSIHIVPEIPHLGSGKINYRELETMVGQSDAH